MNSHYYLAGKAAVFGALASVGLLALYAAVLTFISGFAFMLDQWSQFWPYIVTLAVGFGIQVTLYSYLRQKVHEQSHGTVMAVSGTASTAAMISCCTHYLVNLLPVLGATGLVVFVSQYQIELFWFGIAANLAGMSYMIYKIKTILYV
tara:strand:+ start:4579 stop:5022 length:444 start_codon:yes stop_codon:yes gene_type:complete